MVDFNIYNRLPSMVDVARGTGGCLAKAAAYVAVPVSSLYVITSAAQLAFGPLFGTFLGYGLSAYFISRSTSVMADKAEEMGANLGESITSLNGAIRSTFTRALSYRRNSEDHRNWSHFASHAPREIELGQDDFEVGGYCVNSKTIPDPQN